MDGRVMTYLLNDVFLAQTAGPICRPQDAGSHIKHFGRLANFQQDRVQASECPVPLFVGVRTFRHNRDRYGLEPRPWVQQGRFLSSGIEKWDVAGVRDVVRF